MSQQPSPTRIALTEAVLGLNDIQDLAAARRLLFKLIFTTTPAQRGGVLLDNCYFECERDNGTEHVGDPSESVEKVFKSGSYIFSEDGSVICVPVDLDDGGERLGVVYLQTSRDGKKFALGDLLMFRGIARSGAGKIAQLLRTAALQERLARIEREYDLRHPLLGNSGPMREMKENIDQVARTHSTVLIYGENGTGKEVVARSIHANSERASGPFVAINCAGYTESLLDTALFGYEKGAFTGAFAQTKGEFDAANGGTLLMDEIGELPMALQPKLLRVLQEREFKRVGGHRTIPYNVRIITATNRNLPEMIAKKEFREDLYYRLNVFPIRVPTLRERADDIPLLADFFVTKYAKDMGKPHVKGIHTDAMKLLCGYNWPGNVRELQNLIERAMVKVNGDIITASLLPSEISQTPPPAGNLRDAKKAFERSLTQQTLEKYRYDYTKAAQELGVTPANLHHIADRLGLKNNGQEKA